MAKPRGSLLEGNVGQQIRSLSIPMLWGLASINVFYIADTWFIGQLGTKYLAAFGFIAPVIMVFMGAVFGLMIGSTSVLARLYGAGDMEKLRQVSTDTWTLTFIVITTASIIGISTVDHIFRLMGAPEDLLPMIDEFMFVWYCGLPFLSLTMVCYSFLRATGDTTFQASMQVIATVIMLGLDPLLIYGWAGFPRMELTGAALALVTSNIICFFVTVYRVVIRRRMLSGMIFHAGIFESWKKVLHIGLPSIISNQVAPISFGIVTSLAAGFGNEAVAALGVANRIENVVAMFFYCLGSGISIFAAQNHGAGNYGRIQEAARIGAGYSLLLGVLSAVALYAFATPIAALFDDNKQVILYTAQYLMIVPISYAGFSVMIIGNSIFNAVGKPLPATALIMLKMVVFYVPLAYVMQGYFGFTGILVALMITNIVTGLISYLWNRKAIS